MESYDPLIAKVTATVEFQDGTTSGFTIIPDADANWTRDGGPNGADLRVYGLGETTLDKIAAVLREYQQENTPTHHYHVGSHMQGYSPDHEQTTCHLTAEEARTALKAQLERAAEAMPGCVNPVDSVENENGLCGQEGCVPCREVATLELFVNELDQSTATGEAASTCHYLNDGRALSFAHWIEHTPAGDCEIEHDA